MQEACYVVGYGMIDSLGNNPEECWSNMLSGKDFSDDVPELLEEGYRIYRGYPVDRSKIILPKGFSPRVEPSMTVSQKMALHATNQALEMSNLEHSSKVAVIVGTVSNDVEEGPEIMSRVIENKRNNPRRLVNRIPDMAPSHICSHWKFHGHAVAVYSSCSTSMTAIDYGMYLTDEYDYVIVGGADAGCNPLAMKYFTQIGALGNESVPFDPSRKGFVMGEGAGILILQSSRMVEKYKSTVYAKLYPSGKANDAIDMTNPHLDGLGERIAMSEAIEKCGHQPDFVCGHATATPVGDPIEYDAVVTTCGLVPLWAPKSMIGHTLAGAGALETIYSILSMKNRIIPGIARTVEFEDPSSILVKKNTPIRESNEVLRTLNNSFGFGGKCMAQIIEV